MKKEQFLRIWNALLTSVKRIRTWIFVLVGDVIPFVVTYFFTSKSQDLTEYILPILICSIGLIMIFTIWELSKLSVSEHFHYRVVSAIYTTYFTLSDDKKSLNAECYREEKIECLNGQMGSLVISADHLEALLPFTGEEDFCVELFTPNSNGHDFRIGIPFRTVGDQFAFRLCFHPNLIKGDSVSFKIKFILPHFSVGNSELFGQLKNNCKTTVYKEYNSEYYGFYIAQPTEHVKFDITFDKKCMIRPEKFYVERFGLEDSIEIENVSSQCQMERKENGDYCVAIERTNPKVGTRYDFLWNPATLSELGGDVTSTVTQ
jgi:hypothetical protein